MFARYGMSAARKYAMSGTAPRLVLAGFPGTSARACSTGAESGIAQEITGTVALVRESHTAAPRRALAQHISASLSHTQSPDKPMLEVGDWAEWSRTWDAARVAMFIGLAGDDNPIHHDAEYAAQTRFKKPLAHGMLAASMFGSIFGVRVRGCVYVSQALQFRAPIFVGDTVTARVEVIDVRPRSRRVTCSTVLTRDDGVVATTGEATVLLPPAPSQA